MRDKYALFVEILHLLCLNHFCFSMSLPLDVKDLHVQHSPVRVVFTLASLLSFPSWACFCEKNVTCVFQLQLQQHHTRCSYLVKYLCYLLTSYAPSAPLLSDILSFLAQPWQKLLLQVIWNWCNSEAIQHLSLVTAVVTPLLYTYYLSGSNHCMKSCDLWDAWKRIFKAGAKLDMLMSVAF